VSDDRVLNWGILGAARINRKVIPAIQAARGHAVAALASRTPERGAEAAAQWSIPRVHASYEDLLADPSIDVVYIPLPNSLHAEWTLRAIDAGKHVLCEKPLAVTLDEIDRVAAAAAARGVIVAEAFMYRHHPQTLTLRRLLDDGIIGELRVVRGAFTFTLERPRDVRFDADLGGGALWDVGCYPVSYARIVVGAEPVEVFGRAVRGPTGIDETFAGQLIFASGVQAQFDCGFRAPFRSQIEIVGSTGIILVPKPFQPGVNETLRVTRGETVEEIAVEGEPLYVGEIENLGAAIHGRAPSRVTLADSRANAATLLALLQSDRDRVPVRVADSRVG